MASNRHLGRIIALQTLFEQDFRESSRDAGFELAGVLARNISRYETTVDDKAFIERLVNGVSERAAELDDMLQPVAPEWPIAQIATPHRNGCRVMRSMPRATSGRSSAPSWRTLVGLGVRRPGTINRKAISIKTSWT